MSRPVRAMPALAGLAVAPPIRRSITIGGTKINTHSLSAHLDLGTTAAAERWLAPIAREWLKPGSDHDFASGAALRTALVKELTGRWRDAAKKSWPTLSSYLDEDELNTLVYIANLTTKFDGQRLEKALAGVRSAKHVAQDTVRQAIGPGKLPRTAPNFGIFDEDWAARIPGVEGLAAEYESAAQVDPKTVQGGQKVRLSSDFQLDGTIGGQTTQDADVSFVSSNGQKILVEVAATVDRLRTKMGQTGQAQRDRYGRVREINDNVALAYSTPQARWTEFFAGTAGTSVAEALPDLDDGWGLMIKGEYVSPDRLRAVAAVMRRAEPKVPGFEEALSASQLTFAEVEKMDAKALADRLQRNARR